MKNEQKKKIITALLIAGIFLYLEMCLIVVHYRIQAEINPGSGMLTLLGLALMETYSPARYQIIPFPKGTFSSIFMLTICIFAAAAIFLAVKEERKHANRDTVHGDSKFLTGKELDMYTRNMCYPFGKPGHDDDRNLILSQEMYLGMDNKKTRRNMNVLVIGGSGSGKTFTFVGPNILQMGSSYVITDPSGGVYKEYAPLLEYYGYRIKCVNLDHMDQGCRYNPFVYIHSDQDVASLVTTLIANTTPSDASKGDPFWEKSETALLNALVAFLWHYCDPSMQNFTNVIRLMLSATIDENDASTETQLDIMFNEQRARDPNGYAISQYDIFKLGAGKTLKSILISCAVRLNAFFLDSVIDLTSMDTLNLGDIGDSYSAFFIIIPTKDKTFNFLASMMYSQLFQILYRYSETTAEYGQLLMNSKGRVVKTFRAKDPEDSKEVAKQAEAFLKRTKKGHIVYNEDFGWYEIRTDKNELVEFRGSEALAKEELESLKKGCIMPNNKQSNKGQRVPVHVRMLLDEFANIGKIPEFPETVATIRKYDLSVNIILQSITQLQEMYNKQWESLSGNCDNLIYLGGGLDTTTTEWIAKACGKSTAIVENRTLPSQGAGSSSYSSTQVDLINAAQLRTMDEGDCVIIAKSLPPYKGPKFTTLDHERFKFAQTLDPYCHDPQKIDYIMTQFNPENIVQEIDDGSDIERESSEDKLTRDKINDYQDQKGQEYRDNIDIDGNPIVGDPRFLNDDPDVVDETEERLALDEDDDIDEFADAIVETSEGWYVRLREGKTVYASSVADG